MGSSVILYYGGYETTNIVIVKANKGIEEMITLNKEIAGIVNELQIEVDVNCRMIKNHFNIPEWSISKKAEKLASEIIFSKNMPGDMTVNKLISIFDCGGYCFE